MRTTLRVGALTLAITMASGCALYNPYILARGEDRQILQPELSVKFVGDVEAAITYADAQRVSYISAAAQHSITKNVAATIILPLTAVSLFYGVTGHGSTDRITRMALGAGTIYAGTEFLTSSSRQQLYLTGAQALTCAIVSTRPYMVTQGWETSFEAKQRDLQAALVRLASANSALKSSISASSAPKKQRDKASKISEDAEQALLDGQKLDNQAGAILLAVQQVGHALVNATRMIVDRVNREVPKTEPDLQSLKGLTGGLEGLSKEFAGAYWPEPKPPEETPSTTEGKSEGTGDGTSSASLRSQLSTSLQLQNRPSLKGSSEDLAAKQDAVILAQSAVAAAGQHIASDLNAIETLKGAVTSMGECGTKVGEPLVILPAGTSISITKGKSAIVTATGGAGQPQYHLTGANTDAISISATSQADRLLTLQITGKEIVAGTTAPTLTVMDGSGLQRRDIRIAVVE